MMTTLEDDIAIPVFVPWCSSSLFTQLRVIRAALHLLLDQGASIASMDFRSIIMMRRTNVFWKREKIVLASWHRKKWPLLVIISMYEQTDPAYFVSHLLSCIWWPICWSSKGLSIDSLGTGMLCRFGPKSDISIMKISFYQRKEEPHKTLHCFSDSKL